MCTYTVEPHYKSHLGDRRKWLLYSPSPWNACHATVSLAAVFVSSCNAPPLTLTGWGGALSDETKTADWKTTARQPTTVKSKLQNIRGMLRKVNSDWMLSTEPKVLKHGRVNSYPKKKGKTCLSLWVACRLRAVVSTFFFSKIEVYHSYYVGRKAMKQGHQHLVALLLMCECATSLI